jgi:hypothetical protein
VRGIHAEKGCWGANRKYALLECGKVDVEVLKGAKVRFGGGVDEVVEERLGKSVYEEKVSSTV